jgi:hypothetical protein
MQRLLPASLNSSSRHHLRAVVPKAIILLEAIPIKEAIFIISRDTETAAIIRRLVIAGVKREVTSCRRFQNLDGSAGSLHVVRTYNHFMSVRPYLESCPSPLRG